MRTVHDAPDELLESYEATPYDSKPINATYVPWLEVVSLLHGVVAAPSNACRVLELGCASGGNLIPMAHQLPGSRFVGIDFSPNQIAEGRRSVSALGLTNVDLRAMSIADIDDDLGAFDYIICHGVYSWVPPDIQDAVLRVCSRNLAPTGVAYVSYNVYPGWHRREIVRDMLRFHDDPSLPPAERIARARAFATTAAESATDATSVHASILDDEAKTLAGQFDTHLMHEQLEAFNAPVYFTDFVGRAARHKLGYLGDAAVWVSCRPLPEWLKASGLVAGDAIREQQYLDFLEGQQFRRSLLCHDHLSPRAKPAATSIPSLHCSTQAVRIAPSADGLTATAEAFRSPEGSNVTTDEPVMLAVLRSLLDESPSMISFDELARRVDATPGAGVSSPEARQHAIADAVLALAMGGFVDLRARCVAIARRPSERPLATAPARLRAKETDLVGSLSHRTVTLSGIERFLLVQLDGTRARDDLLDLVERAVASGELGTGGAALSGAELADRLERILDRFASSALLEA
ncbi:MAG TPA: class I SAM-dependent methyltransferase [Gemmatimonadaceae bacterium]|jgi:methyltransferase-like protein/2-polyprenyl-3-methyl-5-hydroxy-6-metoxy-1,4-benzoquinol methylase|nr:class I SAM-dependent methyltransferase [Gemmatimonadaceae bacterium]